MRALLLVDIQNDFMPGGALAVTNGDKILPAVNQLLKQRFDIIAASKDWHPSDHGSFAAMHDKQVGDVVDLKGLKQILWPTHGVAWTPGAEHSSGWDTTKIQRIFHKGTEKDIDSYSAFFDNGHRKSTGLEDYLKHNSITDLYLAGLATDYCVKYSTLDALDLGFCVYVVEDACQGVNLHPQDSAYALQEMRKAGAHIILADQVSF